MLNEDYEKALEAQKKPVAWKRIAKGHYQNPETGVEIKFKWDRLGQERSSSEGWYTYEPQPGNAPISLPTGRQYSLADAKKYDADEAVQMMRTAHADRHFRRDWAGWSAHLDELYGKDR